MSRKGRGFLAAIALFGALPLGAQDVAESYETGLERFRTRDYAAAADAFRLAIRRRPHEEKKLLVSGTAYEPYYPHLYLGLCLEKLGDAERARAELGESQRQGVSSGDVAFRRQLDAALLRLKSRPTPVPPTPTPVVIEVRPTPTPLPTRSVEAMPTQPPEPSPTPAIRLVPTATPANVSPDALALRVGLRQFFIGEFSAAEESLAQVEKRGNATARVFLAYALCGSYLLSGKEDLARLRRAHELYQKVPAALRLKTNGISPVILDTLAAP